MYTYSEWINHLKKVSYACKNSYEKSQKVNKNIKKATEKSKSKSKSSKNSNKILVKIKSHTAILM